MIMIIAVVSGGGALLVETAAVNIVLDTKSNNKNKQTKITRPVCNLNFSSSRRVAAKLRFRSTF